MTAMQEGLAAPLVALRVEIVGEAAGRVPAEVQTRHSRLPWREAISARTG
jgi:uncharacterized protein with HEPN domain